MRPADIENIASDLRSGDRFELTDGFEHTFEVCDSLEEAVRRAPDYGCQRIGVLRRAGLRPYVRKVHEFDLPTARAVLDSPGRPRGLRARLASIRATYTG